MADMGYGLTKEVVMYMVGAYVTKCKRRTGHWWFQGFKARHPNLTVRMPQPLSYARAFNPTKEVVNSQHPCLEVGRNQQSPEQQKLYEQCYSEGYDVADEEYESWLRIMYPSDANSGICSSHSSACKSSSFKTPSSSVSHILQEMLILQRIQLEERGNSE